MKKEKEKEESGGRKFRCHRGVTSHPTREALNKEKEVGD